MSQISTDTQTFLKFIEDYGEANEMVENLNPIIAESLLHLANSILTMLTYIKTESDYIIFNEQLLYFCNAVRMVKETQHELAVLRKCSSQTLMPLKEKNSK
jgi:hypothetical protein